MFETIRVKAVQFAILVLAFLVLCAANAVASGDVMLTDVKVSKKISKMDKNGNPIALLFLAETKTLNGIEYASDTMATCFSQVVDQCQPVNEGDLVTLIATPQVYNGNDSYVVRKIVSSKAAPVAQAPVPGTPTPAPQQQGAAPQQVVPQTQPVQPQQ